MNEVDEFKLRRDLEFHERVSHRPKPLDLLVIPDGNRTYASRILRKSKDKFDREDYKFTYQHIPQTLMNLVYFLKNIGTDHLYFWGNSPENLISRPRECVEEALNSYLKIGEGDWIKRERVRIHLKGDLDLFNRAGYPEYYSKFKKLQTECQHFNDFHLFYFLNYSTKEDIRNAILKMREHSFGLDFEKFMNEPENLDVILRTGGFNRLSGFSPVRSPDVLFYGLDKTIPELNINDLVLLLIDYASTRKNYGA